MSILIKGMDMPKHDDDYVIFTVYGDGGVVYGPLNRPHVRYKDRAVPVPPHGRLIDADALVERFRDGQCYFTDAIKSKLQSAPTILKAEEGET